MNLNDFRIATRMALAFAAVLLLTFALMTVALIRLQQVGDATAEMDMANKKSDLAGLWYSGTQSSDALAEARLRAHDPQDTKMLDDRLVARSADITKVKDKLAGIIRGEDGKRIIAQIAEARAAYLGVRKEVFALRDGGQSLRNLAQRSAAAAREIKVLIDDSVQKVDAGSRLVHQAGATIQEVVSSVQRVCGIMSEIASASKEQRDGIEQVNQAIGQMDQVTQQNAALVEEAAAAAASMREQSAGLAEAVGTFRLDGPAVPAVAASPRGVAAPARIRLEPARGQHRTLRL